MASVTVICNRAETAALPRSGAVSRNRAAFTAIWQFTGLKPAKNSINGTWRIPSSFCCNRRRHLAYVRASAAQALPLLGCGCSSVVEHDLAKVGVEGSNPFARSRISELAKRSNDKPPHGRLCCLWRLVEPRRPSTRQTGVRSSVSGVAGCLRGKQG